MTLKYTTRDLKTDLAIGGINGAIFSGMYGFYTAALETPKMATGYGNHWMRLFMKNSLKVMPLCPIGRIAYSACKKQGLEDWKAAFACFCIGYLYLVVVKI